MKQVFRLVHTEFRDNLRRFLLLARGWGQVLGVCSHTALRRQRGSSVRLQGLPSLLCSGPVVGVCLILCRLARTPWTCDTHTHLIFNPFLVSAGYLDTPVDKDPLPQRAAQSKVIWKTGKKMTEKFQPLTCSF